MASQAARARTNGSVKRRVLALRVESGSRLPGGFLLRPLTVKLNGRAQAPPARHSEFALKARKAPSYPTRHGPFQRLLEARPTGPTVRVRPCCSKQRRHSSPVQRATAISQSDPRLARSATGAAAALLRPLGRAPRPRSKLRPAARAPGCVDRRRLQGNRVRCGRCNRRANRSGPSDSLREA